MLRARVRGLAEIEIKTGGKWGFYLQATEEIELVSAQLKERNRGCW
jgi:hypothetical protein